MPIVALELRVDRGGIFSNVTCLDSVQRLSRLIEDNFGFWMLHVFIREIFRGLQSAVDIAMLKQGILELASSKECVIIDYINLDSPSQSIYATFIHTNAIMRSCRMVGMTKQVQFELYIASRYSRSSIDLADV